MEDSIPKHVPLKIKIKKEKEAGFKDLKNERWAREFELEVTNTGRKPIYFLYLYVVTDVKAAKGFRIVFPLTYGRSELGDIKTKPEPTDVPIQPGEAVSLKIHPGQLDAWDVARQKENRPCPKRLQVTFQVLSFGDATGYFGTDATPIPNTALQEELGAACLPSSQTDVFVWQEAPPGSPLLKLLAFNLPAALGPANFSRREDSDAPAFNLFPMQTCCGGSNCAILKPWTGNVCVNCPPQNRPSITTCDDPQKKCGTTVSDYIECFLTKTGDSYECQTIQVLPCGSSPTPTPVPSPSPSPSPSPTPTSCPLALPSQCSGGVPRDPCTNPDPPPQPGGNPSSNPDGCPFGYQVSGSSCCIPIACPQPTPTPPSCGENETSLFSGPPLCQWSDCFTPFPDPTPPEYRQACVDYYWVWYVSYDGGVTWQPTGQVEYAGCFHLD